MRIPCFTIKSLLLASVLLPLSSAGAVDFPFRQGQRTRAKCALPDHNYDHDAWPYTTPRTFGATEIAVAATDPSTVGGLRKPFHFRANALTVDHITLDQVGLTLYKSDGRLFATGRIMCGGADGGLIGNNVTIRLRAYVAHTAAAAPIVTKPDATLVTVPAPTNGDTEAAADIKVAKDGVDAAAANVDVALSEVEDAPVGREALSPQARAALADVRSILTGVKASLPRRDRGTITTDMTTVAVAEPRVATPNEVNRIPADAYKVWESKHELWVSRGRPHHIQLAPKAAEYVNRAILTRHFDDITHIEVELEYQRDR